VFHDARGCWEDYVNYGNKRFIYFYLQFKYLNKYQQ